MVRSLTVILRCNLLGILSRGGLVAGGGSDSWAAEIADRADLGESGTGRSWKVAVAQLLSAFRRDRPRERGLRGTTKWEFVLRPSLRTLGLTRLYEPEQPLRDCPAHACLLVFIVSGRPWGP